MKKRFFVFLVPNRGGFRDCVSQWLPSCSDCRGTEFGHCRAPSRSVSLFQLLRNNEIWAMSLDIPNCSSGRLKPTPEFLTTFYKYSTLHEPQVLTETPINCSAMSDLHSGFLCYVCFS